MVLRINRRLNLIPKDKGVNVFFVIYWYLIAWTLIGWFGAPKILAYIGDFINLIVFFKALYYKHRNNISLDSVLFIPIIIFLLIGVMSSIVNYESIFLLIWGLRNSLRFFLFFYSCLIFNTKKSVTCFFNLITLLYWASFPLVIYQRFFITYSFNEIIGDNIGGIYHGFQGVTPPLNILIVIYVVYMMTKYFDKKISWLNLGLTIVTALIMAALAELKIFLVEFIIAAVLIFLIKKKSLKVLFMILVCGIGSSFLIYLLVKYNSNGRTYYTKEMFTLKNILEIAIRSSGYDGTGDLNRFSGFFILGERYLNKDFWKILFGIGLGNGDYSNYSLFTSNFYNIYSYLHYQWFSGLFIFLETGITGLISYVMFFITCLFEGVRKYKNLNDSIFYIIIVIIFILMIFYGISLRSEQSGFIMFYVLSIPFCKRRNI